MTPANKKEFQLYTICNLSLDVDSPDKLKKALSEQYSNLLPPIEKMEVARIFSSGKKKCGSKIDWT